MFAGRDNLEIDQKYNRLNQSMQMSNLSTFQRQYVKKKLDITMSTQYKNLKRSAFKDDLMYMDK